MGLIPRSQRKVPRIIPIGKDDESGRHKNQSLRPSKMTPAGQDSLEIRGSLLTFQPGAAPLNLARFLETYP